jgi:hypothetical protein
MKNKQNFIFPILVVMILVISLCLCFGVVVFFMNRDKNNKLVYEHGQKLNNCYIAHNEKLFYYRYVKYLEVKELGDLSPSYKVFGSTATYDTCYVINGSNVFFRDIKISSADPTTFVGLSESGDYAKDSKYVYYGADVVQGADSNTARLLETSSEYLLDGENVYYNGKKLQGADPQTFQLFGDTLQWYGKDKNGVYFQERKISDDGTNFRFIFPDISVAVDSNYVYVSKGGYSNDHIISGMNPKLLERVGNTNTIKDDKTVIVISDSGTQRYIKLDVSPEGFEYYGEINKKGTKYGDDICGNGKRFFNCENGLEVRYDGESYEYKKI